MRKIFQYAVVLILAALFIGAIVFSYFLSEFYFKEPAVDAVPVAFIIEKGDSVKKIARNLKEERIVKGTFVFETYVWLLRLEGVFQPGIYNLKPGNSIASIVDELTSVSIKENRITLIEGWTLRDIANYLLNKKIIKSAKDFYYSTGTPVVDYRKIAQNFYGLRNYDFLADRPSYATLEGYIYPDTYYTLAEKGVEGIIEKALDNFGEKFIMDLRDEVKRQNKTIFQIVTMASIVEKEVSGYENRRMVADLFWRRLKIGMPLQADSTINYVTQSGRERSTYEDLKINSPWNTYKYAGLPLGPICNPSIEAIRAVIYPAANNYLYFLTDKEGAVHYAKTTAEHAKNRALYLK